MEGQGADKKGDRVFYEIKRNFTNMTYDVKVIPRASKNKVVEENFGKLKVYLTAVPEKGKANDLLLKVLAEYFQVKKSQVELVVGKTSQNKVVRIDD